MTLNQELKQTGLMLTELIRRPEQLAREWTQGNTQEGEEAQSSEEIKEGEEAQSSEETKDAKGTRLCHRPVGLMLAILMTATLASAGLYGMVMHMRMGAASMLYGLWALPTALGAAWLVTLPALYIINALLGGRMSLGHTLLASGITVSVGGFAMLAFVPLGWFFSITLPHVGYCHSFVLLCAGLCMADVIVRILGTIDPKGNKFFGFVWLLLYSTISLELGVLLGLFHV